MSGTDAASGAPRKRKLKELPEGFDGRRSRRRARCEVPQALIEIEPSLACGRLGRHLTKKLTGGRPIVRLALNCAEVALAIGVSTNSVDQMVAEGALPPPRKWHSRKLWLVSEIEAHLNDWPVEGEEAKNRRRGRAAVKASGGLPIPASQNDPLQKYYDQIGFDPRTMDASDMERLEEAANARWKASVPGSPLTKREQNALLQFRKYGPGVLVNHTAIKGMGLDTAERLEARGFVDIHFRSPDRLEGYVLTDSGFAAGQALNAALGQNTASDDSPETSHAK